MKLHVPSPTSNRLILRFTVFVFLSTCCLAICAAASAATDEGPTPLTEEVARFDQPPVALSLSRPQYPFEMRRRRIEGDVVVEFTVDVSGRVRDPKVISAPHKDFHNAALYAIEKARFKPAMKEDKPVAVRMRMPFIFRIDPAPAK